jgi:hypothetical protein
MVTLVGMSVHLQLRTKAVRWPSPWNAVTPTSEFVAMKATASTMPEHLPLKPSTAEKGTFSKYCLHGRNMWLALFRSCAAAIVVTVRAISVPKILVCMG